MIHLCWTLIDDWFWLGSIVRFYSTLLFDNCFCKPSDDWRLCTVYRQCVSSSYNCWHIDPSLHTKDHFQKMDNFITNFKLHAAQRKEGHGNVCCFEIFNFQHMNSHMTIVTHTKHWTLFHNTHCVVCWRWWMLSPSVSSHNCVVKNGVRDSSTALCVVCLTCV